jgi:hypothetical protein
VSERYWYYLDPQNAQIGPVPESELHRLIGQGAVGPQTLVWSDNLPEWTPAGRIAALDPRNRPQPTQAPAHPHAQAQAAAQQPATVHTGAATLAPTELILLNGERFASKGGMLSNSFDLIHSGAPVSSTDLGKVISGAAMLSLEQAGAVRLNPVSKKAFLRTVTVLMAEPTGAPIPFPPTSMEASLYAILMSRGPTEVNDLFYILMAQDHTMPWSHLCHLVVKGLEARGLTYTEETKGLIFKGTRHRATPEAMALAAAQDVNPIQQMVGAYSPAQWQMLTGEIAKAVSRRTESSNDGPDFGSGPDL